MWGQCGGTLSECTALILPLRASRCSEIRVGLVVWRRQLTPEASSPLFFPSGQLALALPFNGLPTVLPARPSTFTTTFLTAPSQLRGKATVRVPLSWIPYFLREDAAADDQSVDQKHGRRALIPIAVILFAAAAALAYRVRQRHVTRTRLGLI
jgi:hypothetical protein